MGNSIIFRESALGHLGNCAIHMGRFWFPLINSYSFHLTKLEFLRISYTPQKEDTV